jgi:hypothetical protein
LYFTKVTNKKETVIDVNDIGNFSGLSIPKSVSDETRDTAVYENLLNADIYNKKTNESIFNGYFLELFFDGTGILYSINDNFGTQIYETGRGWNEAAKINVLNGKAYFDLCSYLEDVIWAGNDIEVEIRLSGLYKQDFFKDFATEYTVSSIKVGGSAGGDTDPENGVRYFEQFDMNKRYSKNDLVYYSNQFFISVVDDNVGVRPSIDNFNTELNGVTYWRNLGYSSTYSDKAIGDSEGNNIVDTYALKSQLDANNILYPTEYGDYVSDFLDNISSIFPSGSVSYAGEFDLNTNYSQGTVVSKNGYLFVNVKPGFGVNPIESLLTTQDMNQQTVWVNLSHLSYKAERDSEGNVIVDTYATKGEAAIKTLTSPVRIWDLEDGVYKLPTNCSIQYNGETNTGSFNLGSRVSGILTVSSSNITTTQSANAYEKNIFWEISYGDNQYVTSKIIGRTTSTRGYYNKLYTGKLVGNITTAMAVPMWNGDQTMSSSSNFWLMGTPDQFSFQNVQHSSSCYIKSNELYSNNSKVATQNDLGDQVTYTLSGTTLTITSK